MDSLWWYFVGAFAAFLGFANLENARRRRNFTPITIFFAAAAGYVLFQNRWLFEYSSEEQLVGLGLAFCAVSPFLGWVWWGSDGAILRGLGRVVLAVLLFGVTTVLWSLIVDNPVVALVLGAVTSVVPFRWKGWRARTQQRKNAKEWEKEQQRKNAELKLEERRRGELEVKQGEMLDALIEELRR